MINTSLDAKRTARAGGQLNYDPIPEGDYKLRVKEIEPWKLSKKDIKVIMRDENGNALKDEKGNNLTELVKDCEFYNCNVKFEVVDGEFAGKLVFHNLTTHPNMSWSIDNFLYAVGIEELSASQIQGACVGLECDATVYIDTYEKTVQNKETGLDEVKIREVNRIKSLRPLKNVEVVSINLNDVDLGI